MWTALLLFAAAPAPSVALPAWMAGCWEQVAKDEWTDECWTGPRAGSMMGSSRTGKGQTLLFFEHMRIVADRSGALSFCAMPKGQAGGCFTKDKQTATEIVFVNAKHDYPQRISYWREGKYLMAETSLSDGNKPQRWRYSPKR